MYRRCLYLDADLLFDPHTLPDLFSEFPEGKVWAYNDVHNNPEKMQWLIDEYDRLIVEQQLEDRRSEVDAVKERWCYNTGVILWDTRFSSFLWNPPSHPLVIAPTVEQTWVNINIALSNIPVEPLPIEYNIQPWMFDFHKRLPEAKIVHYSSLDAKRKLFELQKRALQCLAQ
jgi:lipopolysaccharide biosynthesis glycosyltransferase